MLFSAVNRFPPFFSLLLPPLFVSVALTCDSCSGSASGSRAVTNTEDFVPLALCVAVRAKVRLTLADVCVQLAFFHCLFGDKKRRKLKK